MKVKKYLLIFFILISIILLYCFQTRPRNIFEEIYKDEYGAVYSHFKFFRESNLSKLTWISTGNKAEYNAHTDHPLLESYENSHLPEKYENVNYIFNFSDQKEWLSITFTRNIDIGVDIRFENDYRISSNTLNKSIYLKLTENNKSKLISDKKTIQFYLAKYQISNKDLNNYYNEIVNRLVLKDWCSIYNSRYSPSNYGDMKVVTEWEQK